MREIRPADVDPQLRWRGTLLKHLLDLSNARSMRRAQGLIERFVRGRPARGLSRGETTISRKMDGSPLRVLVYRSLPPGDDAAGLLWLHGGGYAIGAPEMDHDFFRRFIDAASCVIVAPDYRLSLRARDKGEVNVAFQLPLYPMLDDRMNTDSARDSEAPVWNSRSNDAAWRLYLADLFGTDQVPKYAAPAREQDYSRLPATYTFVGGIEPFRDETRAYVENLRKAGVPVEFTEYEGCFHAFPRMCPKADVSRRAILQLVEAFKHACANRFAPQPAGQPEPLAPRA